MEAPSNPRSAAPAGPKPRNPINSRTTEKITQPDPLLNVSQKGSSPILPTDAEISSPLGEYETDDEIDQFDHEGTPIRSPIHDDAPPHNVEPEKLTTETNDLKSSRDSKIMLAAIVALAAIAIVAVISFTNPFSVPEKKRLRCDQFSKLHSKYPNQDRMLWTTLIVNVERAINDNPGEPATFIFLCNSSAVADSLLQDVTHTALECFGSKEAIWRSSYDFRSAEIANDYGVALKQYRRELDAQGVLVVRDLDQVPPAAAPVFFTICDSYEPLVRKAIVFFTIDISQHTRQLTDQSDKEVSATSMAETILKDLWKRELNPDLLDPLLVRLTENAFQIN